MLSVVLNVRVTILFNRIIAKIRSFFIRTYDDIVADFHKAVSDFIRTYDDIVADLEAFASREEKKAEAFLQEHLDLQKLEADARAVAAKARKTASNIGKLLG
jgi:hypothetical protein